MDLKKRFKQFQGMSRADQDAILKRLREQQDRRDAARQQMEDEEHEAGMDCMEAGWDGHKE